MTPDYRVIADGADITRAIRERLMSMTISDEAGFKSDTCEITIDDRDGTIQFPKEGTKLVVSLGFVETGVVEIGAFSVDAVKLGGPIRTMTISAKAVDFTSVSGILKDMGYQTWTGQTLEQVAQQVAQEAGLSASVAPSVGAVVLDHAAQTAESKINFLTRMVERYGGTLKVQDGKLVIAERHAGQTISGKPAASISIAPEDCVDWSVTIKGRTRYSAVTARFHDRAAAEEKKSRAGTEDGLTYELPDIYPTEAEANAAAAAKKRDLDRGDADLSVTLMRGNPNVYAEGVLTMAGFRFGVDGKWRIKQVRHEIDNNGYMTSITGETGTSDSGAFSPDAATPAAGGAP